MELVENSVKTELVCAESLGGQALKRPWKEQKALFVQNTVSKARGP